MKTLLLTALGILLSNAGTVWTATFAEGDAAYRRGQHDWV